MIRAAALILAAALASSAMAQSGTGTLVQGRESSAYLESIGVARGKPKEIEAQPSEAAFANARGMAACVIKRKALQVRSLLDTADVQAFQVALGSLWRTMSDCAGKAASENAELVQFQLRANALRGLFADAWFKQYGLPRQEPIAYDAVTAGSDWITSDPAQQVTLRMADCLAARQPERVGAVLYAPWGSPDETSAIQALAPLFGTCLEKDVTLTTKKTGLRLALASAVDRRANGYLTVARKN